MHLPVIERLPLESIRAYDAKLFFRQELNRRLDDYIRTSIIFYDFNRWISTVLDFLGAVFSCAVASFLVYGSTLSAGSIGFTMSLVLTLADSILYIVQTYNSLEASCKFIHPLILISVFLLTIFLANRQAE